MAQNIYAKLSRVRTFIFDLDGVLTDGNLIVQKNEWFRTMSVKDGYALQLAVKCGYRILVISGSKAPAAGERLQRLGIDAVFFNVADKKAFLSNYCMEHSVDTATVLFMGDDVPDGEAMQWCGLSACPSDAAPEIKTIAGYVSPFPGGRGCVRDVIEKVLRLNGHWTSGPKIPST